MADAAWCENSGGVPSAARMSGDTPAGTCWRCGRRVKLLSNGRLRRHRVQSGVVVLADGAVAKS